MVGGRFVAVVYWEMPDWRKQWGRAQEFLALILKEKDKIKERIHEKSC